jgi:RNA polymerase sigma-70 factor, ECF subfamily
LAGSPAAGADRDERDDRTLLAAHVDGEPEAFGILFRRHRDRLWALALRTTGDREEAADALQDAMVSAFRRAGSYRGDAAVTTWLHRIVVNACLDRLRRQKVRAADPLPDDLEEYAGRGALGTSTSGGRLTPDAADPAELVLDEERRAAVLDALVSLTPEQRAALVLVDMQGFSTEEAAAILGCAPGTVKSRCSRGRSRLAPLLAGVHADVAEAGSGATPRGAAAASTGEPRTAVERPSTGATGGGETP